MSATVGTTPSRPRVGITCDFLAVREQFKLTVYERYAQALAAAGAVPLILPARPEDVDAQLAVADGVLLTGGDDLDPTLWGGTTGPHHLPSNPRRTAYELALARAAMDRDVPFLGICLGAQLLNVARGGSLRTDLHGTHVDDEAGLTHRHDVDVVAGTLLSRVLGLPGGGRMSVNSSHHDAPQRLGAGLVAAAIAPDGVVEAVEEPTRTFCLGVQWHPEGDFEGDAASRAIFGAFVEACERAAARGQTPVRGGAP
jgi:putative glutamine amidotransferase